MRELATIRKILEITPIEGADQVCIYTVDGWNVVDYVDRYKVGELCVYFEIDSFLPIRPEFEFLRARCFKKMGEQEGMRLKTVRFKGQVSQGLLLPVSIMGDENYFKSIVVPNHWIKDNIRVPHEIGADCTEYLGVQKYELPIPAELEGKVRGNFPDFIKKTDQARCQNRGYNILVKNKDTRYEITMKLHGTSFTGFYNNDESGVCGRNWILESNDDNTGNYLVKMYLDSGMQSALKSYGKNIAVQGELMGPGIEKNREKLASHKLYVFDIFDIDTQKQLGPDERKLALQALYDNGLKRTLVEHVPIFAYNVTMEEMGIHTVAELLTDAEGESIVHPVREGKVYKSMDGQFTFKAISDSFLLKEKD